MTIYPRIDNNRLWIECFQSIHLIGVGYTMMVSFQEFHLTYCFCTGQFGIFPRMTRTSVILKVTTGKEVKVTIRNFHHTTGYILRRTIVTGGNVLTVFVCNLREFRECLLCGSARTCPDLSIHCHVLHLCSRVLCRIILLNDLIIRPCFEYRSIELLIGDMPFHCIDIVITTWSIVCHCRHVERIVIIGIATIKKRTNLEIVENLGKTYQRISVGVGRFRQGRSITAEVVIMKVGKYGIINRTVTCPYHTLTNVISYNL